MSQDKMMQEMFDLFKTSTEATWSTINMLQNQTERMANVLLEQTTTVQTEGRKQMQEWMSANKKSQVDMRKAYDDGVDKLAELMSPKAE